MTVKLRTTIVSFLVGGSLVGCSSLPGSPSAEVPAPGRTQASAAQPFRTCPSDPQKQAQRSAELQLIVATDQSDRQASVIDWAAVMPRDEARAKRVAEIFGEGCITSAKDYAAAALVFQHGIVPDHYYQAYLWSKRAVEFGDVSQKWLMAAAIDRYLINIGHKQLFGAQAFPEGADNCMCLGQTEMMFPDQRRVQMTQKNLKDRLAWIAEMNKSKPSCKAVTYCQKPMKPTPPGSVPGLW